MAEIKAFSDNQLDRIGRTVRAFEENNLHLPTSTETSLINERFFWAIIVGGGPASEADYTDQRYFFKRAYPNNTGSATIAVDFTALPATHSQYLHTTGTNLSEEGSHLVQLGTPVIMFWDWDQSSPSKPRYFFSGGTDKLLMVRLTQTSGSAGTLSTPCTFTYTAKTDDNLITLGTTQSPLVARPNGKLVAASYGLGVYTLADFFNSFHLLYAFEIPDTGSCLTVSGGGGEEAGAREDTDDRIYWAMFYGG